MKLLNWEFWPWQVIYFPVMLYWLWLSIRARSPFYFFAANPGIESGGLLIESKYDILQKIPGSLIPATLFFTYPSSFEDVIRAMDDNQIRFPVMAKPDHGERGWGVEKLEDSEELKQYIRHTRVNFLIQEFIDLPVELGIFYYRYPDQSRGEISSVVRKERLFVTGDGNTDIRSLIQEDLRARMQAASLEQRHPDLMNYIPGKGEQVELVPVGNHCRGATFLNGNELIDQELSDVIDGIATRIDGFFYGRFDIRCRSVADLKSGRHLKIIELNGAKSEPAHIYDPEFPLSEAYRVLFFHWKTLYKIAIMNHRQGVPFPSWKTGWKTWKKFRKYQKLRK